MKKIALLAAVIGSFVFSGCEGPEGPRGATGYSAESTVLELRNVNFTLNQNNEFTIYRQLGSGILLTDNIVIYRLSGTIDSQTPIWQPIPRTIYFDNSPNEFDYDYDFSREDYTIYAGGNYDITTTPNLLNDETFRIVIIPGYFGNKSSNLDTMDYKTLISTYKIDDSKVRVLN